MVSIGALFRKCDFQVHSPRDLNWEGERPGGTDTGLTPDQTDAERRLWAIEFLDACVERGIRAVALTDHHEAVMALLVRSVLRDNQDRKGYKDLWFFPGMELTCADSAQALIIFDAEIEGNLIERARTRLGLKSDCNTYNSKGIEVEVMVEVVERIEPLLRKDPELQNRFIILPNVTPKGHKTLLRKGFQTRFSRMPYCGGYLDGKVPADIKEGDARILGGEVPEWRSSALGVISTSDARQSDFRKLGTPAAYLKLSEPTAESIRQAMLAHRTRIIHDTPLLPEHVITTVIISNSTVFGNIRVPFNPYYTALIGGRGAGKSTLLEYVRFALGRSAYDLDKEEFGRDATHARRLRLLKDTLLDSGGSVAVETRARGATIIYKRTADDPDQIMLSIGDDIREVKPSEV